MTVNRTQSATDFQAWSRYCYRLFASKCPLQEDREDLAAEALIKIYRALERGDELTAAFVAHVCRGVFFDYCRRQARQPRTLAIPTNSLGEEMEFADPLFETEIINEKARLAFQSIKLDHKAALWTNDQAPEDLFDASDYDFQEKRLVVDNVKDPFPERLLRWAAREDRSKPQVWMKEAKKQLRKNYKELFNHECK